ncbi:virulence factor [Mobilisporobacter senegalensis]|uniref:Virulence factor n=1 Tax=Mobilisporobacter senegalensis TaxID=1329262 RepID=A0A3N1XK65_9FIRM|nr:Gfo/Idh/MocA family oxidoreductase [Mobilisporobacter senegalensis]ROR27114.1 virulence factor [Mobilisporobacter senegalensis]
MRIGIIGIGDIAKKAYLPVMTRKKNLEIILCSRNEELLKDLMNSYRGIHYVTSVKTLIESGVKAAFIHAATSAHYGICKELLDNGIHVYVDKPISYKIEETRELYELAKKNNLILRVGFNRRKAPLIADMKKLKKPDVVIYQKNRVDLPADIREYIYDDFIHVVDSIRYLLGEDIENFLVKGKVVNNLLYSVTLQVISRNGTAIGIMNRESGKTEERIEFICPGEKRIVEDLNNLTVYKDGIEIRQKFGDWEPVLYRRGFEQITDTFLEDVTEQDRFLEKDEDSLKTHELCELIVEQLSVK